jgi:hypothetical protein
MELELPSLRIVIDEQLSNEESLQERIATVYSLAKIHNQTYLNMATS